MKVLRTVRAFFAFFAKRKFSENVVGIDYHSNFFTSQVCFLKDKDITFFTSFPFEIFLLQFRLW